MPFPDGQTSHGGDVVLPRIAIVGGGIAGAALALFLKKAGMPAAVYEAHAYAKTMGVGGSLNIAPNGMHVLAALGLADRVIERGSKVPVSHFRDSQGRLLGRLAYGVQALYGQPAVTVSRSALAWVLADEMRVQGIEVHENTRLKSIDEHADAITLRFEDGTHAQADCVVGADGIHSRVRHHILPQGPRPEYLGMVAVGGSTPLASLPGITPDQIESLTYTFGTNFFGYGGGDSGTMIWWSNLWRSAEYSAGELAQLDEQAIRRELLAQYRGFAEPIPSLIAHSGEMLRLNLYDIRSLSTWQRGRALLIGDAAHAVSPNAGQGASLALEDAMYLAKLLREARGEPLRAFRQFETDRKPRVEAIVAEGRRRGGDKKTVSVFKARLRNAAMHLFLRAAARRKVDPVLAFRIDW